MQHFVATRTTLQRAELPCNTSSPPEQLYRELSPAEPQRGHTVRRAGRGVHMDAARGEGFDHGGRAGAPSNHRPRERRQRELRPPRVRLIRGEGRGVST